jgi:hypothetical protein
LNEITFLNGFSGREKETEKIENGRKCGGGGGVTNCIKFNAGTGNKFQHFQMEQELHTIRPETEAMPMYS